MTYYLYPESNLAMQDIIAPAFDLEELNWTIPLSFNFTFPDKESTPHISTTSANEAYTPKEANSKIMEDSSDLSVMQCYTPYQYPLLGDTSEAMTLQPNAPHSPKAPLSVTSYIEPLNTDHSDLCLVAQSLRDRKKWGELKEYISETCFPSIDHSVLQTFFYESVYETYKIERGLRRLTPPQRYRLRKTNPLPSTICSTKFRSNNHLDDNARALLEAVFKRNIFPSREVVENLVANTGLSAKQVKNYFKNNRSRK